MDARNRDLPAHLDDYYSSNAEHGAVASTRSAISIPEILETLRRGWRFPVYGCLVGLVAAGVYLVSAKVPYKSSARILIDRSVSRYLETNKIIDQPTLDEPEIASQVYVLSSDSVIVPVVRSLQLTSDTEFVAQQGVGGLGVFSYFARLKDELKKLVGWNTDPGADAELNRERIAVEAVLKNLTVFREDVANVISITFESQNPDKAADIANAVADTYISTTVEAKLKSTQILGQWLQQRLAELKTQATEADRALQEYKSANNLVATRDSPINEVSGLRTQLTNAHLAVAEAKERLDLIQRTVGEGVLTAVGTDALLNPGRSGKLNFALNNSDLVRLRSQLRDLTTRKNEVEARVGSKHTAVTKMRDQIEALTTEINAEEKRIADAYVNEYQIATARETELAAALARLTGDTEEDSQAQVTMRELESSAETLRNLYNSFLQKFKAINTVQTENMPIQNARIITRAAPPLSKSSRKALAIFFGSPILGFMFGCGLVMAREWASDVLRTAPQVEELSERKCVILPKVAIKSTLMEEYVLEAPYSRFTETIRNIKALIGTMPNGEGASIIGVVSSVPEEGKTIVAANLASLIVASSGARTLVIDSDLHLRKLTAALAPDARNGIVEALKDPSRLSDFVIKRARSGLDILPCVSAARIPNAAELLGSREMEMLLAETRKSYDFVIIEIAPIMSVVDVKTIERFIDTFVFVVEWGQTKRGLVLDALAEVPMIRDRLAGMVLNKADPLALRHMESYKGDKFQHYYQD